MSEMIERVARAIAISDRCDPDKLAKHDPHLMMESYTQYARAAIEAMRDYLKEHDDGFQCQECNAMVDVDAALGKVDA